MKEKKPNRFSQAIGKISAWLRQSEQRSREKKIRKAINKRKMSGQLDPSMEIPPAIERITNQLVEETVGDQGVIATEFNKIIQGFDPNVNPLTPDTLKSILAGMLKIAVANRKLINGRLAESIEIGALQSNYYNKLEIVSYLMVEAHIKMKDAEAAYAKYQEKKDVLANVAKTVHLDSMKSAHTDSDTKQPVDAMAELEKGMHSIHDL